MPRIRINTSAFVAFIFLDFKFELKVALFSMVESVKRLCEQQLKFC
jgi:hypothetical protein